MYKVFILTVGLLFSVIADAVESLPLYQSAIELEQHVSFETDHIIALSKNKKINGQWRFDDSIRFQGVLIKTLYEINAEEDINAIIVFYDSILKDAKYSVLFACKGRYCGSSNEWANATFKESRLYGVDDSQAYWIVKSANITWVLYLIRRGNDRIYWYVETLQTENLASLQPFALASSCEQLLKMPKLDIFLNDKMASYFLIVQQPGINTLLSSQQMADACMKQLIVVFPKLVMQSLGLGEFDRLTQRRVDALSIELLRVDKQK